MKILLPVLLAIGAIGAVIWVMLPTEAPAPRAVASAAPAEPALTGRAADPAPALRPTAATGREATARAVQVAKGEVDPAALAAALTREGPAPQLAPASVAPPFPEAAPDPDAPKWGRAGKPPFSVDHSRIKAPLRSWYGNAPKAGPLPPARLEELLPADIIGELNLPAKGQVLEIGPWPASDRRAFDEVLNLPDGQAGAVGLTVQNPDGTTTREYVFLGDVE